ncbi:TPA: sugar ABC transporter ATP-binding protein [Escherichia coli]|nr:sugar ABC transporter ATP-binding protein [Escherichia coli]
MFTATEAVPVAKVVAGNKRYPGVVALDNVNFTLNKGEVRALLGKNGAGKSTLIRMLTGSERPDSGDIWIGETRLEGDEATLTRRAAELGVRAVYQELSLVEGLTVAENLCLGQWPRRNGMIDYPQMAQDAQRCLLALGVDENTVLTNRQKISANGVLQWSTIRRLTEEVMQRMTVKAASSETPIGTLSGGNQQKVVIGRWVYAASQILLLDEPTRGVDIEAKQQIYRIVRELAAEGKSVVFISSEVEELPLVCDRILLLQHGTFSQEFHSPVNVDELMSAILSVH